MVSSVLHDCIKLVQPGEKGCLYPLKRHFYMTFYVYQTRAWELSRHSRLTDFFILVDLADLSHFHWNKSLSLWNSGLLNRSQYQTLFEKACKLLLLRIC